MIVLDTHVIIWDALNPDLLSAKGAGAIAQANETDGIVFCEISLWEIAMLVHRGRIRIGKSYLDFIRLLQAARKYTFCGISPEIAELSTRLPPEISRDPADRIIASTAIAQGLPLVTADEKLRKAGSLHTIW